MRGLSGEIVVDDCHRRSHVPARPTTEVVLGYVLLVFLTANLCFTVANFAAMPRHLPPPSVSESGLASLSQCPPTSIDAEELAMAMVRQHKPVPSAEALQYHEPKSVDDEAWKASKYLVFRNDTMSGKYLIEGLEKRPDQGLVLVYTAFQDRTYAWFDESKTWTDVTGMDVDSEDFAVNARRKLLWWNFVGGIVGGWAFDKGMDYLFGW